MIIILLGIAGFATGILFDWFSLRGWVRLKSLSWIAISGLLLCAHFALAIDADKVAIPGVLRAAGAILLVGGFFMLCYSLFLEIPMRQTYFGTAGSGGLVRDGTYALSRHPGVIWYAIALIGLFLCSASRLALQAGPVWLLMDVLWVWVEDRFVFDRAFEGYAQYRETTPMLIPTVGSASRFWKTFALRLLVLERIGPGGPTQ